MEVFRGECNFSQSSWVRRKGGEVRILHVNAIAQSTKSIEIEQNHKHRKKYRIPIFGYFRVSKEYPLKSQIWQSETSPNQGIPNQIPRLGLVSLFQIWDVCGYSLNTLKYPKMGIRYFFLCIRMSVIDF